MEKLVLIYGATKEDREICQLIMGKQIPCEFVAAPGRRTPVLLDGYSRISSINEIRDLLTRIIEGRKKDKNRFL